MRWDQMGSIFRQQLKANGAGKRAPVRSTWDTFLAFQQEPAEPPDRGSVLDDVALVEVTPPRDWSDWRERYGPTPRSAWGLTLERIVVVANADGDQTADASLLCRIEFDEDVELPGLGPLALELRTFDAAPRKAALPSNHPDQHATSVTELGASFSSTPASALLDLHYASRKIEA